MNNTINNVSNLNFRTTNSITKPCENNKECDKGSNCIDLTDVYTQENIIDILREAGTYNEPIYPCKYSINYHTDSESLVIKNTNMTNDVTIIKKDGTVTNCGSWHNKEIARDEKYANIVNDAQERIELLENK